MLSIFCFSSIMINHFGILFFLIIMDSINFNPNHMLSVDSFSFMGFFVHTEMFPFPVTRN